mgnify:FL=1
MSHEPTGDPDQDTAPATGELETILDKGNIPFKSMKDAEAEIKRRKLSASQYAVFPTEGGFEIRKMAPPEPEEEYRWVVFMQRANQNDQEQVELRVNGEAVLVEREKRVPMARRFLVCADNGVHHVFHQEPGQQRKVVGKVTTFPYQDLGPATKKEFDEWRTKGTQKTIHDHEAKQPAVSSMAAQLLGTSAASTL